MVMFISFVLVSYTHSNSSFQMMKYNLSTNGEVENEVIMEERHLGS